MSAYNMAMRPIPTSPWTQAQFASTQLFEPQTYAQYGVDEPFSFNDPSQYHMDFPDVAWDSWTNGYDNTMPHISTSTAAWGRAHSAPTSGPSPSPSYYTPEPPLSAPPFSLDGFGTSGFGAFDTRNLGGSYNAPFPFPDHAPTVDQASFPAWTNVGSPSDSPGFYAPQEFNGMSPCDIFRTSPHGYPQGVSDASQFSFPGPACMDTLQGAAMNWSDMEFASAGQVDDLTGMCNIQYPQHARESSTYPSNCEQAMCPCSSPVADTPVATARPLKRRSDSEDEDSGLEERPSKRVKIKSSKRVPSKERNNLVRERKSRSTTHSRNAAQNLPAAFQGNGRATLARRQVDQELTRTHVLEMQTNISEEKRGKSLREMRSQEKNIIQAAIGKPPPDLSSLTTGGMCTLEDVREEVWKKQICRFSDNGTGCCGKALGHTHNSRERHYVDEHRGTYPPCDEAPRGTLSVTCPQPGCGEEFDRLELEFHLRKVQHRLADMRFLRLVCPNEGCPMGMNEFVPGSKWYYQAMNKHKNSMCSYKGPKYHWRVVDEEPDLADYPV